MEVKMRTLTPLWTGDLDQNCREVKETGIVGSLRWWYEVLVRAYRGQACDPTDSACDGKEHCDACELFGCTGWSRKFRIEVDSRLEPIQRIGIRTRTQPHLSRYVSGLMGELDIRAIPVRELKDDEIHNLAKTLQLVHRYASLGAKTAQGNGVISVEKLNGFKYVPTTSSLHKSSFRITNLPDLSDFFFSKFRLHFENSVKDIINKQLLWGMDRFSSIWADSWIRYKYLPIAFHIRDAIRPLITDRGRRREVFGKWGRGSKIFVSHGYRIDDSTVEIRIFGHSLQKGETDELRKSISKNLPEYISKDSKKPLSIRVEETEFKTGMELL